jgi:hypothetical protein
MTNSSASHYLKDHHLNDNGTFLPSDAMKPQVSLSVLLVYKIIPKNRLTENEIGVLCQKF